jgi:hypothetical protein
VRGGPSRQCALAVLLGALATVASAQPQPLPLDKQGACPSGYYPSGRYCVPGANARYGMPKLGACPPGYYPSGNYCVASVRGRLAVPKTGACPPGYFSSGAYCVQSRSDDKSGSP